jgi:ATP-binding cassette subfamily B protein
MRLEHIFATIPSIADAADATPLPVVRGKVEFRHVTFAYPSPDNGHPVVNDLSFTLEPGQKLGIVGRTGAGKSSIVQLLPRLFDVAEGAVLLDGRDVRTLPLAQLRRAVGIVPQDPFLSRAASATTSRSGSTRWIRRRSSAPPRSPASPTTSNRSRTATTRSSASAASRCRAARSNA